MNINKRDIAIASITFGLIASISGVLLFFLNKMILGLVGLISGASIIFRGYNDLKKFK